jgi:hypothetical protein
MATHTTGKLLQVRVGLALLGRTALSTFLAALLMQQPPTLKTFAACLLVVCDLMDAKSKKLLFQIDAQKGSCSTRGSQYVQGQVAQAPKAQRSS